MTIDTISVTRSVARFRRPHRIFLLPNTTQQVRSFAIVLDLLAASATVVGICAWGLLFTLLAG